MYIILYIILFNQFECGVRFYVINAHSSVFTTKTDK